MIIDFNDPQLENKLRLQEQVYNQVRLTGNELTQVAVDHTPIEGPTRTVRCPSCSATQTLTEDQTACTFCGSPLTA
jgi:hypothetical protein